MSAFGAVHIRRHVFFFSLCLRLSVNISYFPYFVYQVLKQPLRYSQLTSFVEYTEEHFVLSKLSILLGETVKVHWLAKVMTSLNFNRKAQNIENWRESAWMVQILPDKSFKTSTKWKLLIKIHRSSIVSCSRFALGASSLLALHQRRQRSFAGRRFLHLCRWSQNIQSYKRTGRRTNSSVSPGQIGRLYTEKPSKT